MHLRLRCQRTWMGPLQFPFGLMLLWAAGWWCCGKSCRAYLGKRRSRARPVYWLCCLRRCGDLRNRSRPYQEALCPDRGRGRPTDPGKSEMVRRCPCPCQCWVLWRLCCFCECHLGSRCHLCWCSQFCWCWSSSPGAWNRYLVKCPSLRTAIAAHPRLRGRSLAGSDDCHAAGPVL